MRRHWSATHDCPHCPTWEACLPQGIHSYTVDGRFHVHPVCARLHLAGRAPELDTNGPVLEAVEAHGLEGALALIELGALGPEADAPQP